MVEVGGVEPPSESTLTGLSPGADGYFGNPLPCSPSGRQAVTPAGRVRVMMRGQVNSFPPHGRHINDAFPGLWPLRFRRPPLIRQQQQQCCCYLIYKLPVLWRSGAAARWSRLHTPVETGTPPRRRGKLRSLRFHERPSAIHENCVSLHCPPLPTANTALVYGWSTGGKPFADLSAGLTVKNHNTLPPGNVLRFRDIFILSGFCQFNHQLYRGDLGQHAVELIE